MSGANNTQIQEEWRTDNIFWEIDSNQERKLSKNATMIPKTVAKMVRITPKMRRIFIFLLCE